MFVKNNGIMCTITLSYDKNNALARYKLAELLKSGLFEQGEIKESPSERAKASSAHKQEVKEFLYGSRILASKAFAKHL